MQRSGSHNSIENLQQQPSDHAEPLDAVLPAQNPGRWRALFLWWTTHALVGGKSLAPVRGPSVLSNDANDTETRLAGTVRVVFEAEMIAMTRSPRFGLSEAGLAWLLQAGTVSCVAGKLLCGPLVPHLGVARVGVASLFLCSLTVLGVGLPRDGSGAPLISVFVAWNLMRFFQTATWPATNQLLLRWFPKGEHGRAWGIMSTASRSGILSLTLYQSVRDSMSAAPELADRGDAVQTTFLGVGLVMMMWALLVSRALQDQPPTCAEYAVEEGKPWGVEDAASRAEDASATSWGVFAKQLAVTMLQPIFVLGMVVQACATPLAEFQSQVPILVSRDTVLSTLDIGHALTLWHLGILVSALAAGWLFDRSSALLRIPLIAGPVLVNALVLGRIGDPAHATEGAATLGVVCLLGATAAPANFLVASVLISKFAPPCCMASISCIMVCLRPVRVWRVRPGLSTVF